MIGTEHGQHWLKVIAQPQSSYTVNAEPMGLSTGDFWRRLEETCGIIISGFFQNHTSKLKQADLLTFGQVHNQFLGLKFKIRLGLVVYIIFFIFFFSFL